MLSPKIETKRLILRRYKELDIDAIYDIITDKRLSTYIKFPELTKEQELECIKEWIEEPDDWETYRDLNGRLIEVVHDYGTIELDESYEEHMKTLKKYL